MPSTSYELCNNTSCINTAGLKYKFCLINANCHPAEISFGHNHHLGRLARSAGIFIRYLGSQLPFPVGATIPLTPGLSFSSHENSRKHRSPECKDKTFEEVMYVAKGAKSYATVVSFV